VDLPPGWSSAPLSDTNTDKAVSGRDIGLVATPQQLSCLTAMVTYEQGPPSLAGPSLAATSVPAAELSPGALGQVTQTPAAHDGALRRVRAGRHTWVWRAGEIPGSPAIRIREYAAVALDHAAPEGPLVLGVGSTAARVVARDSCGPDRRDAALAATHELLAGVYATSLTRLDVGYLQANRRTLGASGLTVDRVIVPVTTGIDPVLTRWPEQDWQGDWLVSAVVRLSAAGTATMVTRMPTSPSICLM
jgi:hypothetical protein